MRRSSPSSSMANKPLRDSPTARRSAWRLVAMGPGGSQGWRQRGPRPLRAAKLSLTASAMPTALDNGQRSTRNLLRKVVARLLGGLPRTSSTAGGLNERVAVVAGLRPGSRERAAEILAKGAPYGLTFAGFRRHSVFLAEGTVVFVFEGPGIQGLVRDLVNDPAPLGRVQHLGTASRRDSRACARGVPLGGGPARVTQNPA
jgi:hypothetical protein